MAYPGWACFVSLFKVTYLDLVRGKCLTSVSGAKLVIDEIKNTQSERIRRYCCSPNSDIVVLLGHTASTGECALPSASL